MTMPSWLPREFKLNQQLMDEENKIAWLENLRNWKYPNPMETLWRTREFVRGQLEKVEPLVKFRSFMEEPKEFPEWAGLPPMSPTQMVSEATYYGMLAGGGGITPKGKPPKFGKVPKEKLPIKSEVPTGKEPWMMTREEYVKAVEDKRASSILSLPEDETIRGMLTKDAQGRPAGHKKVIERALSEGKPVPPEVLKDYPDLAKSVKPTTVTPEAKIEIPWGTPARQSILSGEATESELRSRIAFYRKQEQSWRDAVKSPEWKGHEDTPLSQAEIYKKGADSMESLLPVKPISETPNETAADILARANKSIESSPAIKELDRQQDAVVQAYNKLHAEANKRRLPNGMFADDDLAKLRALRDEQDRIVKETSRVYEAEYQAKISKRVKPLSETPKVEAPAPKIEQPVVKPTASVEDITAKGVGGEPPKVPPEPPKTAIANYDDELNKFGKYVEKSDKAFEAQKEVWAKERIARSERFNELLGDELKRGVNAETAYKNASKMLEGTMPREQLSILPDSVRDAGLRKIKAVIDADDSIPIGLKGLEIKATSDAFLNAASGKAIPNILGIKGGSAKTRLLKVFQDNPEVKRLIENPEDVVQKLLQGTFQKVDSATLDWLSTLPAIGKQSPLAAIAPDLRSISLLPQSTRGKLIKNLESLGLNIVDAISGIPKAVKFAFDLSYMERQLGIAGKRHPIAWAKTWKRYLQAMRSDAVAAKLDNMIKTDPERMMAIKELGLDLYEVGRGAKYWNRPETVASTWAEKWIPGVRLSNRGAAVASNYFVTEVGKGAYKSLKAMKAAPDEMKAMGSLLNELVGRGELPHFLHGSAGNILNRIVNSPRFTASRFEVWTKLISPSKIVRQEAWSTLAAWVGFNASVIGIAKASGAGVEGDPRSSEILKIKVGNKRIDMWQGFAQIVRLAAQLAPYVDENGKVDWTMGSRKTADGRIIPVPRSDVIMRFAQSKETPGIGALISLLTGKDFVGKKIDFSTLGGWGEWLKDALAPASLEEMADAFFLEGLPSALASSIGLAGVGVNTYDDSLNHVKSKIPSQGKIKLNPKALDRIRKQLK